MMLPIRLIIIRDIMFGQPNSDFALIASKITNTPSDTNVDIAAPLMPINGISAALPKIFIIATTHWHFVLSFCLSLAVNTVPIIWCIHTK